MKNLKIYLDTSVYSALYDSRDLVRQKQTKEFWNNIHNFELYYSDINLAEINGVTDQKLREKLETLLKNGNKINVSSEIGVNLINLREGYKSIEILVPPEL